MNTSILNAELWQGSGGIIGLVLLALFFLIILDKVLLRNVLHNLPERLRCSVISSLFDMGVIPERRKKTVPVNDDKRAR